MTKFRSRTKIFERTVPPCEYAVKLWEQRTARICVDTICPDLQKSCLAAKTGMEQCSMFSRSVERSCVKDINFAMMDALKSVKKCDCTTDCGTSSAGVCFSSFMVVFGFLLLF